MIAIIAEKPSLARNVADGIGKAEKRNGYFVCGEYIVTWAFGHLFTLCDVEDYLDKKEKTGWNIEDIPCFPDKFKYRIKDDGGVKRQFSVIKSIVERNDVSAIVNAGDSDREGEIIIRICVNNTQAKNKPFYRLWLPDQTPETVKKALSEMKEEREYDRLANEGFARTYVDWLYGVNLTRYATLKTGALLRVGRVIVPIVKAIYDRDKEIENFKPEKYYALCSDAITNGEKIELVSKYTFKEEEKAKAERCCEKMNILPCVVTDKTASKEKVSAGKLYSLTKLQNVLGRKYKMPMDKSLSLAQSLYEKGYLSYPRTNSEYLSTNEKDKIKKILSDVKNLGYPVKFKEGKNIFDDSKIESHSALTPTYKIPEKSSLSDDEFTVYQTVFRRFVAVFCERDCVQEKTEITLSLGGKEDYVLKGSAILEAGWTKFDGYDRKDKILPKLSVGDKISVNFHPELKQTSPPKHYTIETLNNYLKNPFKTELSSEENDEEDYKAIFKGLELGTEATRTGIIENAKKSGYISLKKDVYRIENNGKFLIEQLKILNISMDKYKTSTLGQALKKVYGDEISVSDCVEIAKKEISEVFKNGKTEDVGLYGEEVGICPVCGEKIVRGRYSYACRKFQKGCNFRIGLNILGATVTKEDVRKILTEGKTDIKNFVSKNGKKFSCALKLTDKNEVEFDM